MAYFTVDIDVSEIVHQLDADDLYAELEGTDIMDELVKLYNKNSEDSKEQNPAKTTIFDDIWNARIEQLKHVRHQLSESELQLFEQLFNKYTI